MQQQFYLGIVEDRLNDPLKLGRVRVRVFGVHSELLADVPTSSLPWAIPLMPATSASLSGIGSAPTQYLEGSMVFVFFQDGDAKQQPIILGSAHGIPLSYDPYDSSGTVNENFDELTGRVTVDGVVIPDSATAPETPVPVETSPTTTTNICCTKVDTTKLLAKYSKVAANVTLVGKTLCDYGIKNPYAIIAILSNIAKECKFVPKEEDLNYRTRTALEKSWPARFKPMTDAEIKVYFNNPQKLANFVYSNRNGNGAAETNDGYKYRGYGFIQLTGRANFKKISKQIGVDIEARPELAAMPITAAKVVAQFFITAYGGANRVSFTSLEEALVSITRTTNSGGFKNDYPIVVAESKLLSIIGEVAAETNPNPTDPVNDVNPNATMTEINAGRVSQSFSGATGFRDMSGKYPLKSRLAEPDTHRLSRRTTIDTLIEVKNKNRRRGIRSIDSEFSEPAPAYNAKYPFNHVYTTESGHVMEFDDTAGAERIGLFHTSGTYSEVDKYGNKTNKIVGDSFTIIERNGYIYVDGTARLTVNSDVKIVVAGNMNIEVDGNLTYDVGGDVTWKVGGSLKHGIGGNSSTQAGGNMLVDASKVYFNSGMSEHIGSSARDGRTNDYDKREPENYTGETTIVLDDVHDTELARVDTATEDMISNGTATQKEIDTGTATKASEVDTKTPNANLAPLSKSCLIFNGDFSDNIQISRRFTLAMLTSKAYFSHSIVAQHGLTKSQLACNLKGVAENCLDKIKEQYPKMFITSGFRPGNSSSQHELGQAIDMQFDQPNSAYFEIAKWIRDNVVFDKLLLEYKTTGTGKAWIHIAYRDSPRREVYTFMNDKKHSNGLANLG